MTRKDFALIATVIADQAIGEGDRLRWAKSFAFALAEANPSFDRERFLKAAAPANPSAISNRIPGRITGSLNSARPSSD